VEEYEEEAEARWEGAASTRLNGSSHRDYLTK